jgi:hypothetical protein
MSPRATTFELDSWISDRPAIGFQHSHLSLSVFMN